ncbi:transporter substrate-binding domain-containing protein [Desulforhopalus sp. IMCC35007]|uniref:transporter substrate-binding domain-containing protein n=1 Tax=Desulforhopalus sp. IMCC35007 TaxID=2569543 RepID=UPI0010AEC63A|nr:transporter substrate-binding domain-containing protein [Desulforhopalus sp. IMCC35007]TKB06452.1 transporter substrate-binding domain-containing protein [Desulforhopalus sp. IMCC35007]
MICSRQLPALPLLYSLFTLLLTLGCTPAIQNNHTSNPNAYNTPPLRVGISADMPPMVYKIDGRLQGLEIDLAQQLGVYLKRPVKFIELDWDKQIPSLEAGKIDIIMSGMTITPKRAYRVSFTQPYMRSGQLLLVRSQEAKRYSKGIFSLMGNKPAIGTITNTTGDFFVTRTIHRANITRFSSSEKAVSALIKGDIDAFVHDAPVICYLAAQYESARLSPILQLAKEEMLAWAVNRMDQNLLSDVNTFLTTTRENQQLSNTITHWIPYIKP